MKHYEIEKANAGWTKATVTLADGTKQTYECFYDEAEAAEWCYAQLRYEYGKELAEKELGAKLNLAKSLRK